MSEFPEENHAASYQVVARRYRPQGFDELIGQEQIAHILAEAIKTGRVGHAYLFTGSRGVGKTSAARIFAKALNCEKGPTTTPCNQCEICEAITSGEDIDVLEIDGASNRGVEEIRQIRSGASIRPSRSRYKIYIIDEVHMLTRDAFNALLKTLEEPPGHVKFIFCTTEPQKIPITILSRCQRFDFSNVSSKSIAAHLASIAAKEGLEVEPGVLELLARHASGSMRDALSLLEQLLSFSTGSVTLDGVHAMLGTVDDQKILDLVAAVRNEDTREIFKKLDEIARSGVDFGILMEQLLKAFRDLLAMTAGCTESDRGEADFEFLFHEVTPELQEIAAFFGADRIIASMQLIDQAITRMRYSTQSRVLAELTMVRLARLRATELVAALIDRLKAGNPAKLTYIPDDNRRSTLPPSVSAPRLTGAGAAVSSDISARVPAASAPPRQSTEHVTEASAAEMPPTRPPAAADLRRFSPQQLKELWTETLSSGSLGPALSAQALSASGFKAEDSSTLVVFFPDTSVSSMRYCQTEDKKILSVLTERLGGGIHLKWATVKSAPPAAEAPSQTRASHLDQAAMFRQKVNHPIVRAAEEIFGAQLRDVRPPEGQ
ncbi:MAG: DNA polymerase III subunit gamma/tau [Thermoguttaceae bacterium]|nr:DNA polymerase III subunit gamma/tau [Thermoguttaceae bacterium]